MGKEESSLSVEGHSNNEDVEGEDESDTLTPDWIFLGYSD